MRIEKEVKNGGVTESGLSLFDRDGIHYHWFTKQYSHPLFFLTSNEWIKVRMTISKDHWGNNIAKNVRRV